VELVSRAGMTRFLKAAADRFDVVLLDGPPLIGFSETAVLARQAKAVVVAIRARSTTRDAVRQTLDSLANAGVALLGGVITFADRDSLGRMARTDYAQKRRARRYVPLRTSGQSHSRSQRKVKPKSAPARFLFWRN
jgi:Mrp family chromosome partitioning ATPase